MEDTGNKKQELDVPNENHLKILGKKHTVIGTKNSVNRWDSTMVTAEERICIEGGKALVANVTITVFSHHLQNEYDVKEAEFLLLKVFLPKSKTAFVL